METQEEEAEEEGEGSPPVPLAPRPAGGANNNQNLNEKKCGHRSCVLRKSTTIFPKYKCWVPDCTKEIHLTCYNELILKKNQMEHFAPDDMLTGIVVVCGKKHQTVNRVNSQEPKFDRPRTLESRC